MSHYNLFPTTFYGDITLPHESNVQLFTVLVSQACAHVREVYEKDTDMEKALLSCYITTDKEAWVK